LNFLVKTKEEVERSLDKEKLEVNKMANNMYSIWTRILEERKNKGFLSTNVELKVH
jgi:transposase-like protein